ncbi:MAG: hypothetical protein K2X77_12960 [Candidatus Obscuribacterales bacterium]|jgi:serine/threonine protein kinase|nr:hypothetical protein [Candidatus Obscuribacterales bacterium]
MTNTQVDNLEGKRLNENYRVTKVVHWSEHSVLCEATKLDSNKLVQLTILENASIKNIEQFEQACKKASKLKHEALATLYDLNKTSEGEPFLSSEPGEIGLANLLEQGETYQVSSASQLITDIIDGLIYLEHKGIQASLPLPHRIFLQKKIQKLSSGISSRPHQDGTRKGALLNYSVKLAPWCDMLEFVPEDSLFPSIPSELERTKYLPPDSIRLTKIDARSQIYTLACIFYQLITGRPPFRSDELVDLQSQQLCSPPPRLHDSRPDLFFDPALEAIITKALEKDPSKRYRSLLDFRFALQKFVAPKEAKIHRIYSGVCISLFLILFGWASYALVDPIQGIISSYQASHAPHDPDPFGERPDDLIPSPPADSITALLNTLPPVPANAINLGSISDSVHLKSGDYFCNKITLDGNKRITAEDNVKLWIKPEKMQDSVLDVSGTAGILADKDPHNFDVYYVSQANIVMTGKSKLDCHLLAPAAVIEASGEALISGEVTSNGQILRDKAHFLHVDPND